MTTKILQWKWDKKNTIKAYLLEYVQMCSYFQNKNPTAGISWT